MMSFTGLQETGAVALVALPFQVHKTTKAMD